MRIVGWCEKCHKIKQVTVRYPRGNGVQMGICSDCEEKKRG